MQCIRCGFDLVDLAADCPQCGLSSASSPQSPAPEPTTELAPHFVAKHWRGLYPLATSYWGFGLMVTLGVMALVKAIDVIVQNSEVSPRASGALVVSVYLFALPATVWQFVGIWRSATRYSQLKPDAVWGVLAKLMVVIGVLRGGADLVQNGVPMMTEGVRLISGVENIPPHQIRVMRDGTEIELAGGIRHGTAAAFGQALASAPGVKVVHLNSQGGRMGEAFRIHRLVKARGLTTFTAVDCASACTVIFLAGKQRLLSEKGRLGFHSASVGESGHVIDALNNEFRSAMLDHGAPREFVDRALSTRPDAMWYPSAAELQQARIVDAIVDPRQFALSGIAHWSDPGRIEAELKKNPAFAAMAEHDPKNYDRLREIMVTGVQKGRSMQEIHRDTQAVFHTLLPQYMRTAPDAELVRYWRSQFAGMRHLMGANPQDCVDFLWPEWAKTPVNLFKILPPALIREDFEALAGLVKGAAQNPRRGQPSSQSQQDMHAVFRNLGAAHPRASEVLEKPVRFRDDPSLLCRVVVGLYAEVLSLPAPRAAAVLRRMQPA
ncbi:MAG: hypothetical protein IPK34_06925 [Ramlibacter sp.]|jgi:hypothetical protein|nr:hypothetical protein [Ramlibacter sp.]